jgi:putative hydrolase of the HAD superfamily
MGGVDAVIFDWGGTLSAFFDVDFLELWRPCADALAPHRADDLCRKLIEVEERAWSRVHSDQRSSRLVEMLAEATHELGLDPSAELVEEAAAAYLQAWTPYIVHERDVAPTLRWLRERHIRTGLLSNTAWPRTFHEEALERDGLIELLDVRCYTSELTHIKPHELPFGVVLEALGVEPEAAVFVGDRPLDDIAGAKAAGMRAVLKPNHLVPTHDTEPDAVITSLADLPRLIEKWQWS